MKLKEYLDKEGIKYSAFARKVGIHPQTIATIIKGYDTKLSIGVKIEEATNGAVRCRDLMPSLRRNTITKQDVYLGNESQDD